MPYTKMVSVCIDLFGVTVCNEGNEGGGGAVIVPAVFGIIQDGWINEDLAKNLLATVLSQTTAEIVGDEGINGNGSMYTIKTIKSGEKIYVEYLVDVLTSHVLNAQLGWEVSGKETPNNDVQDLGAFSLVGNNWTNINGAWASSGGILYTTGDYVGLAIDYSVNATMVDVYLNGIFQKTIAGTVMASSELELRPTFNLGIVGNSVGSKGSIYTKTDNQTHPAPTGYTPLDD